MYKGNIVAAILPALDEEKAIEVVLQGLNKLEDTEGNSVIDQIVVCDNGSTDATAIVATKHGAKVIKQPQKGYGIACQTAIKNLDPCDIVLFIDADDSCYVPQAVRLIEGIISGDDLAIGSRTMGQIETGALTRPQAFGNMLATFLISRIWKQTISDLGPFRAMRYDALMQIAMKDERFGWTVEMQIKAFQHGLVVSEYPVDSKKRIGASKISGTVRGVYQAGKDILGTILTMYLAEKNSKLRRSNMQEINPRSSSDKAVDNMATEACLVVFCKRPKLHQGKQRLAKGIGAERALLLADAFLACALEDASAWRGPVIIAVAHHEDLIWANQFLDLGYKIIAQGQGNLGQRLNRIDHLVRECGHNQLVFIGTDAPALSESDYQQVLSSLDQKNDAVLISADDGGVVLMANNVPWPDIDRLPWSTSKLGEALVQNCHENGLRVARVCSGFDVDTADVLPKLLSCLRNDQRPARMHLKALLIEQQKSSNLSVNNAQLPLV